MNSCKSERTLWVVSGSSPFSEVVRFRKSIGAHTGISVVILLGGGGGMCSAGSCDVIILIYCSGNNTIYIYILPPFKKIRN